MKQCSSCQAEVFRGFTEFLCPACSRVQMVRCDHCKVTEKPFSCPECGFEGP